MCFGHQFCPSSGALDCVIQLMVRSMAHLQLWSCTQIVFIIFSVTWHWHNIWNNLQVWLMTFLRNWFVGNTKRNWKTQQEWKYIMCCDCLSCIIQVDIMIWGHQTKMERPTASSRPRGKGLIWPKS